MKAFIFAAGKGTRLQPFTLKHPKALAPVNGIPLLERNIRYLQSYGIQDFIINIHHFGQQIIDFLEEKKHFGANIQISDERQELLETGGGLIFAREYLEKEEDFLVMNADILTTLNIRDFIKYHQDHKNLISLAVSDRDSSRKLLFNTEMELKGWQNKNTGETKLCEEEKMDNLKSLAFSGIHCIHSNFLKLMRRRGKFSIMEEYLDLMKERTIKGYQHNALFIDVGRPESIIEAEKFFK